MWDLHEAEFALPALRELLEEFLDPPVAGALGWVAILEQLQELGQPGLRPVDQRQVRRGPACATAGSSGWSLTCTRVRRKMIRIAAASPTGRPPRLQGGSQLPGDLASGTIARLDGALADGQ
jgi:hypothetical protein